MYREERRGRMITCQECGAEMTAGSLRSHLEMKHDVYTSFALPADAAPQVAPRQLPVVFNVEEGKYWYPVPGCPQGAEEWGCKTHFNLWWHFGYRHLSNEVVIGGQCLSHCRSCGMQVAWSIIGTPAHKGTKTCKRMTEQRAQHQVAEAGVQVAARRFTVYGTDELRNVERFC